jgi:hypothetical protein
MDSPEMILALVALAFLRQAVLRVEFFVPTRSLAPLAFVRGLDGSSSPTDPFA